MVKVICFKRIVLSFSESAHLATHMKPAKKKKGQLWGNSMMSVMESVSFKSLNISKASKL